MQNKSTEPPIKVGDEVVVTIEGVGEKGDGLAKIRGFIVFVAGTKKGQRVKVRITKVFSKMGFGEVIEKVEKSKQPRVSEADLQPTIPEPSPEDTEDFGEEEE
jgi:predicted RNA-binding protein with TRAM domain